MATILEDEEPRLPSYCRFHDIREAGVADSWQQLGRMIDHEGFPPGRLLSPNIRVWEIDEIKRWMASRPTARKVIPPRKNKQQLIEAI
jgi:predicted DNA-binding transcriptional regulator AlpA